MILFSFVMLTVVGLTGFLFCMMGKIVGGSLLSLFLSARSIAFCLTFFFDTL